MRLKILLTGKDKFSHEPDAEMLRERGFLVYRCDENAVNDMIDEVHPDVLIINRTVEDQQPSSKLYKRLLRSIKHAKLPLIYTLAEDDMYLVNRSRTIAKEAKNFIADNIIDGIKTALDNGRRALKNRGMGLSPTG